MAHYYLAGRSRKILEFKVGEHVVQQYENPGFGDDEQYPVFVDGEYAGFWYHGQAGEGQITEDLKKAGKL